MGTVEKTHLGGQSAWIYFSNSYYVMTVTRLFSGQQVAEQSNFQRK